MLSFEHIIIITNQLFTEIRATINRLDKQN